ncbi:hypothetical protein [Endozoicomonas sp. 8E]|uniref:hypothetical protein n=1 Tax=Endozoicomonas sp. 8E TaxID=3035692 RepID=UPI00293934C6|nr:hypothetical protein [Endozoicomonas sp. 8E]WOG27026.1 hypothetical protein P6910_21110 [Endozoicomonas sp. 8E]
MFVVCQAEPWTGRFTVELEQDTDSPGQSFSIEHNQHTSSSNPSDIAHKSGCSRSALPSGEKRQRSGKYEIKSTIIESVSWQWFYAVHLLVAYELVLTSKDFRPRPVPYSWPPGEVIVAVAWLLKNYWSPDSPLFKPIEQQASRDQLFAIITMMHRSGHDSPQCQSSASYGQQTRQSTINLSGSFTRHLNAGSGNGNGNGDPQLHLHTLDINCYVSPCSGLCTYRPSSDSRESAEWPLNSPEKSIIGLLNGHSEVQPLFEAEPQTADIDGNPANICMPVYGVAPDSMSLEAAYTTDLTGSLNHMVPTPESLPFIDNFPFINEPIDLQSFFEEIKVFNTLTHSETQQTTIESSQLGQSPPHLPQTDSLQTLSDHKSNDHTAQKTCKATMIGKDGQPKPCGKICKNARVLADHKRKDHTGQQTCNLTLVGEDGQQRPCGQVCKNARALSSHKSGAHSGQRTCDAIVVGEDSQPRPCAVICKNSQVLTHHKRRNHSGQKTCDAAVVGENGELRTCGTVCKHAEFLSEHKRRYHSGQKTCQVIMVEKGGQKRQCGTICNNSKALANHKRGQHSEQQTCSVTVVGKDGQQQKCGMVCKNSKAMSNHKIKDHSGQQTCYVTLLTKDGQQRPCGKVCKNAKVLADHKRYFHSGQQNCGVNVVGEDGLQRPCGKLFKNTEALNNHKRKHIKRKPFEADQDDDLSPEKKAN